MWPGGPRPYIYNGIFSFISVCHPDGDNVANKRVQYQVYLNNAEREQLR